MPPTPSPAPERSAGVGAVALALAVTMIANSGCGTRELPPPSAPDRVVPELEEPPPPPEEGRGVVVIDATNGPAKVYEVLGTTASGASVQGQFIYTRSLTTRLVCNSTPCFATGPLGAYGLILESSGPEHAERNVRDHVAVDLRRRPAVVRHTFGEGTRKSPLGTIGSVASGIGLTGVIVGAPLWFVGTLSDSRSDRSEPSGLTSTGGTFLGLGALTLAAGIVMMIAGRPTHQPGATTQWHLEADDADGKARPAPAGGMTF